MMALTPYTIYRKDTGEIATTIYIGGSADLEPIQVAANVEQWGADDYAAVIGDSDGAIHYIAILDDQAVIADRPELIVTTEDDRTTLQADGIDTITLTGLPDPCEIIVDDPDPGVETQSFIVDGGGFVFSVDDPGVYTIEVRRWPFLPFKIEFTAT